MDKRVNCTPAFGRNIKNLRMQKEISQDKVCTQLQLSGCDIGRSTYSKLEQGQGTVKTSVLKHLAKMYSCTVEDLFAE